MPKQEATPHENLRRVPTPVLSFHGELTPAQAKRFEETIIFVPFFGAKKSQLKRHTEFVAQLGFDSVVFDLRSKIEPNLFSAQSGFGFKHIWADQIEKILNEVPGRKIVFSFSNPSASAIEAISRRHASDIAGLICDGGPAANLLVSMVNYYKFESPITLFPLRWAAAVGGSLVWHPRFTQAMFDDLKKLPERFQVLSIRGWKDPLIPPDQIDAVFEPHHHLDWSKLSLIKGAHLNGLKDFRSEYAPGVSHFLESIATAI